MNSVMPALAFVFFAGAAHADGEDTSPTEERVRVTLGAMHISNATTLQVDSSTGVPGTTVGWRRASSASTRRTRAEVPDDVPRWRTQPGVPRLFHARSDRQRGDQEPMIFRDTMLQPGDPLQSALGLRLLTLTYGYSFWHSDKVELAARSASPRYEFRRRPRSMTEAVHIDQTRAGPVLSRRPASRPPGW